MVTLPDSVLAAGSPEAGVPDAPAGSLEAAAGVDEPVPPHAARLSIIMPAKTIAKIFFIVSYSFALFANLFFPFGTPLFYNSFLRRKTKECIVFVKRL